MGYKRYAVYFGPRPNEPLHDFGKSWFGTDPETGASLPTSPLPGYSQDTHSTIIKAPRHYALHGTLKPPFVLADGTEYDALKQAVSDLAVTLSPVTLSPLYLKDLSGFLALCPAEPSPSLRILAGRCVAELDQFRRPASEGEIEMRRAAGLTPDHDANLLRWGYPYVLDDFRFHITLTSRLQDKERQTVAATLSPRVSPILTAPTVLQDLCLYGEPEDGSPFRIVARIPLG